MKICKTLLLLFILIISTYLLTSCWNYKEINDMSLIQGLAIDKIDNQYKLTGKIILATTGQEKEGTIRHFFISANGITLFDSLRNFTLMDGKKVYFGHLQYIIISETIAREGINKVLDFFMRDNEIREDILLFIASKPFIAGDVIHSISRKELENYIEDISLNVKSIPVFYPMKIYQLVETMNEKCREGVVPLISIKETDEGPTPHIEGNGAFIKDKMVGTLTGDESNTLMLIKGQGRGSLIPIIYTDEQHTVRISLEVFKNKTKIQPRIRKDGSIDVYIHMTLQVIIGEIMSSTVIVTDEKGIEKLTVQTENYLRKKISELVTKFQKELKTDVFCFGKEIKNQSPSQWKKLEDIWLGIFPSLPVDIDVTVKIIGSNLFKQVIDEYDKWEDR